MYLQIYIYIYIHIYIHTYIYIYIMIVKPRDHKDTLKWQGHMDEALLGDGPMGCGFQPGIPGCRDIVLR